MKLKRELTLSGATIYGISLILGTGIYTLVGVGAGLAGNSVWIAFAVSALIAFFTSMSYAELASIFPKEAAAYHYTKEAFGNKTISFTVDWMFAFSLIMFSSTEALGFSYYLSIFIPFDQRIAAVCLLAILAILNFIGLKLLSLYNKVAVSLSVLALLAFAFLAFTTKGLPSFDLFQNGGGLGIVSAISVVFFAFTGFESVADVSEEVKNGKANVPRAIILSLAISTAVYLLVVFAALNVAGADALSSSKTPLALAASKVSFVLAGALSLIALLLTSNTSLTGIATGSRVLYGMSAAKSLPSSVSSLSGRGTPALAIALTAIIAIVAVYSADIKTTAQLTNAGYFIAYFAVNMSMILLRDRKSAFRSPRVAGLPVFAILGALSSLAMLVYLGLGLWPIELAVLAVGLLLFYLQSRKAGK